MNTLKILSIQTSKHTGRERKGQNSKSKLSPINHPIQIPTDVTRVLKHYFTQDRKQNWLK